MNAKECEREAFVMFEEQIKRLCAGRWGALEKEDRQAEASLIFLAVLRTPNLPEENILHVYQNVLNETMSKLNREKSKDRFHFSLDAPIKRSNGEEGNAYIDFQADPEEQQKQRKVEQFLIALPETERNVCAELLADPSCRKAAYKLQMPLGEVERIREILQQRYASFDQTQLW